MHSMVQQPERGLLQDNNSANGGSYMFDDNASGRKIYVPTASVSAYKAAEYWSYYADDIVGYDF